MLIRASLVRDIFRRLHFSLGLVLSVPLVVLGITGSILAIGDAGATPRTASVLHGTPRSVDEIVQAAEAAAPLGYRPALYVAGSHGAPARVVLSATGRGEVAHGSPQTLQRLVDPVSLAIRAPASRGRSLYSVAHDVHANVLAGPAGRRIVGWFGVGMLVLVLTGPIAWWPGRRRLREGFVVRGGAGGFRWFRDLHRATGIWAFLFLAVIMLTGTFIVFPEPIGRVVAAIFPGRALWRTDVPSVHRIPGARFISADDAVALARKSTGSSDVRSVGFARPNQPIRVELVPSRPGTSGGSLTVLIDPWARRVIDVRDPRSFSVGERIVSTMRPLHEGHILGWPWRAVLFCTGLFPPFFAFTGITMWLLKWRCSLLRYA